MDKTKFLQQIRNFKKQEKLKKSILRVKTQNQLLLQDINFSQIDYIYIGIGTKGNENFITKDIQSNWRDQCFPCFVKISNAIEKKILVLLLDNFNDDKEEKEKFLNYLSSLKRQIFDYPQNLLIKVIDFDITKDLHFIRYVTNRLRIIKFPEDRLVIGYFIKFKMTYSYQNILISPGRYLSLLYKTCGKYKDRIFEWCGYNMKHPNMMNFLIKYEYKEPLEYEEPSVRGRLLWLLNNKQVSIAIATQDTNNLKKNKAFLQLSKLIYPFTQQYLCVCEHFIYTLFEFNEQQ